MMKLDTEKIERAVDAHMQTMHTPGFALAIVHEQEVLYAKGFGSTRSDESAQPITPDTLFCIGSVTKSLVSVALMRLVERNVLALDTPVGTYMPLNLSSEVQNITMRMLLSHTSGLPTVDICQSKERHLSIERYLQQTLAQAKRIAPPGKLYHYSNLGFILAGYIAEQVMQRPFSTVMKDLLFDVADMQDTSFAPFSQRKASAAFAHLAAQGEVPLVDVDMVENSFGGAAGLAFSTIQDIAHFAQLLINDGVTPIGQQILQKETLAEIARAQAKLYTPLEYAYGLGMFTLNFKGEACLMHMGSIKSYYGEFRCFPRRRFAMVALSNFCQDIRRWRVTAQLCNDILDLPRSFPAPRPVTSTCARWETYVGSYFNDRFGLVQIEIQEHRLVLRKKEGEPVRLSEFRDHLYVGDTLRDFVGFVPEESGPSHYMILNEMVFQRQ